MANKDKKRKFIAPNVRLITGLLLDRNFGNSIEVLISTALIDWVISPDEFVLINNVLKEYDDMKEKVKI